MKPFTLIMIFLLAIIALHACGPFAKTNRVHKRHVKELSRIISKPPLDSLMSDSMKLPKHKAYTVNFGLRKPNYVVLHHTAQSNCDQTLNTFTKTSTQVSAHYVICRDGTVGHMLNDYFRAWHAGASRWGNDMDVNSASIGIELDNDGIEKFSEPQLNALLGLLSYLQKKHNIPAANFIGHGDVAPGRKVDPSVQFPWKRLAEKGFGLWYDDTTNVNLPQDFNTIVALRVIGYDVSDPISAIQAFRRHFLEIEMMGELNEQEKKVLYQLMQKFM
jgi:N-acetylmuramoyl-L-alanine amidase